MLFHEHTTWLAINIMRDKFRSSEIRICTSFFKLSLSTYYREMNQEVAMEAYKEDFLLLIAIKL